MQPLQVYNWEGSFAGLEEEKGVAESSYTIMSFSVPATEVWMESIPEWKAEFEGRLEGSPGLTWLHNTFLSVLPRYVL